MSYFRLNAANFTLLSLCWITLLVLSFRVKFFETYLPNEPFLFGDLKYVLACGGFYLENFECNDYMYGRWFLVILSKASYLHPYPNETALVIIGTSLIALAHLFMNLRNNYQRFLMSLLLISPPIALLIQRGNIDILVFFLCWYSIKLFFGGHPSIGLSIAVFASIVKIYPIILFGILFVFFFPQAKSNLNRFYWLTVMGVLTWSTIVDIRNIPWLPSDARNSFGLRVLGEYIVYVLFGSGKQMSPILGNLVGAALLGVLVIAFSKKQNSISLPINQESYVWILFFISIYSSGISVDYRLIFLLPALSVFNELDTLGRKRLMLLFIPIFYLSFPFEIMQVFGDLGLSILISILFLWILRERSKHFT